MKIKKFQNKYTTGKGEQRASIEFHTLRTLWFNTGTLCNLECQNCYIESSPTNDRLSFLNAKDVEQFLIEIQSNNMSTHLIGLTGGEPFLNPSIIAIIETVLSYDHELLILTNANRVIKKHQENLLDIHHKYPGKMKIRVSLDHYTAAIHDQERGEGAFERTLEQMQWLYHKGFDLSIAGRSLQDETPADSYSGHEKMLHRYGIKIDLKQKFVIFPEMQSKKNIPEISTACWDILGKKPEDQMCATERMVVKRKGAPGPVVMPCTLLAYDESFIMGKTLREAQQNVYLNHRFCAEFCVLGGASCSSTK